MPWVANSQRDSMIDNLCGDVVASELESLACPTSECLRLDNCLLCIRQTIELEINGTRPLLEVFVSYMAERTVSLTQFCIQADNESSISSKSIPPTHCSPCRFDQ